MSNSAIKYATRDLETLRAALSYVKDNRCAVQAGGCLGVFPAFLADHFDAIYCAEPDPDLFVEMTHSICSNKVVKLQVAFGNDRGLVSTVRRRRDGNALRENHEGVTHVIKGGFIPTLKIDDLALPYCDFLCLDVEGYELYALQGARETIRRCRPVIMVEINSGIKAMGLQPEDVRTNLRIEDYELIKTIRSDEIYLPRERSR